MNLFPDIIKHLSIKRKLMMLGMVTSTIAVFITCTGFVLFNSIEERHDIIDEMMLVGKILAEEISSALVYNEKDVIDESLSALIVRDSIVQACVYDINGNEFTRFMQNTAIDCKKIPKLNKKYDFFYSDIFKKHLVYATDIKLGGIKRGAIYTFTTLETIDNKIKRALYNSGILFIIIIGISYVISRSLQKNISDPIIKLANISYAVKSGDYDIRAQHVSSDEIGELTESFNNMLTVIQDAKINLEKKVKKRTADLEKAMKVKEDFLSNMSHEIRTPVHGIMNYAEFLVHDWNSISEEKRFGFIKKLYSNSDRLMSLINNLLDLSKLEANKMEFYFLKYDLVDVINNALIEVEPLYIEKNINIIFEKEDKQKYEAFFDQERILQVLRNLLSNAIKFTKEGTIEVKISFYNLKTKSSENNSSILVSIKDEGIGIPENEFDYIFDKFNQSTQTRTKAGGTGLGLAICKDIIKSHRGKIWAENNIGNKGATFFFAIPVNSSKRKVK